MIPTGRTRVAAVIGWPISHSRSPTMHGYWLERYGIDGVMVPLAVAPADLDLALKALARMGFVGANVTLPHKAACLGLVDEAEAAARAIGAVNTIVVGKDHRLLGSNTDGLGFIAHLRASVPAWRADAGPVVVLGAGGAARAVVYALLDAGVRQIRLLNRTAAKATRLAGDFRPLAKAVIEPLPWDMRQAALDGAGLLVNATSLGMEGQPPLDLALERLAPSAAVADIVYAPLKTDLLRSAEARGHVIVDGLGMLIEQARPGFRAWFGREPEVTADLRARLAADIARDQR